MQTDINFKPLVVLNLLYYLRRLLFLFHNRKLQLISALSLLAGITVYNTYFSNEILNEPLALDIIGDFVSVVFSIVIPILGCYLLLFLLRPLLNLFVVSRFIDVNNLKKKSSNELRQLAPTTLMVSEKRDNIDVHHAYGFTLPTTNATLWQISVNIYGRKMILPLHYVVVHIPLNIDNIPHFYLDSTRNGKRLINVLKLPNVGLDLEGPFYKYFIIHHGRNQEAAIRYILPPNRMEKIMEYGKNVDFEFDKNSCWLISKGYCVSEHDIRKFIETASKIEKSFS